MKKFFLVLAAVVAMGFAANAQDNAIGIRFGGGSGYGAELSYQQGLGGNRLEVDLGLSKNTDNYFHLTGMYHWVLPISGGFNWYVGPGAQLGYCSICDSCCKITHIPPPPQSPEIMILSTEHH